MKLCKLTFMCSIQIVFYNKYCLKKRIPRNFIFSSRSGFKKKLLFSIFSQKKEYGSFLIFFLFLPQCKTVNFCVKIPLIKGDLEQTSLIAVSSMLSFRRLRHLAFFVRGPFPRPVLLYTTEVIFISGNWKKIEYYNI